MLPIEMFDTFQNIFIFSDGTVQVLPPSDGVQYFIAAAMPGVNSLLTVSEHGARQIVLFGPSVSVDDKHRRQRMIPAARMQPGGRSEFDLLSLHLGHISGVPAERAHAINKEKNK